MGNLTDTKIPEAKILATALVFKEIILVLNGNIKNQMMSLSPVEIAPDENSLLWPNVPNRWDFIVFLQTKNVKMWPIQLTIKYYGILACMLLNLLSDWM